MTHFTKICSECKKVIAQCRCMDCIKVPEFGICDECKNKPKTAEPNPILQQAQQMDFLDLCKLVNDLLAILREKQNKIK
jgi:hypothetical protein